MRTRRSKGFTLVEILIVVVILGILAAIVVPQFTNATNDAQAGNLKAQLSSLQNQIELFKARTNNYPDFATNGWDELVTGGYLKAAPKNPHNGSTAVANGAAGTAGNGWHWDTATNTLGACYFNESTGLVDNATP
jgi:general secretion pathway protein G